MKVGDRATAREPRRAGCSALRAMMAAIEKSVARLFSATIFEARQPSTSNTSPQYLTGPSDTSSTIPRAHNNAQLTRSILRLIQDRTERWPSTD
ncbi:unnamed protein product [Pieris brassicae]|uniref:Uncharacterized protein n=1 Tax=Pieris brassicae TaxID=7116 RepID=A0A9P0X4Y6_PIEBR|nr:unnamed protein product [Pieris brassicae]